MEILGKRKEFSMNKKFIIALILIIITSIVTTFAIIIYNLKSVQNIGSANETIENFQTTSPYTTVPTSYDEVKLSPNAILTFLKHYDGCGHTLKEKENIYINNNLLQEKEKEIYKEKEKENSSFTVPIATKKRSFTPPTLEEITEYCKSRNNSIDPKTFYDYYSAPNAEGKTWIDRDGTPVKNWKQKVITWEGRRKNGQLGKEPYEETRTKRQWNISYDVDGTKG